MICVGIVGALAAIGLPSYRSYIDRVYVGIAVADIADISRRIKQYVEESGSLPSHLSQVGADERKDPWGNPYVYVNLQGDGSTCDTTSSSSANGGGNGGNGGGNGGGNSGTSQSSSGAQQCGNSSGNGGGGAQPRKNKNLVPINSDFDLYSIGKDGQSTAPLTAKASRDDVVRASDGAFVGLASEYDP